MKKDKNFLVLLVVILIAVGIFLSTKLQESSQDISKPPQFKIPGDWSDYENPFLPLSLSLPSDWKVAIKNPSSFIFESKVNNNQLGFVEVHSGPIGEITQKWIDKLKPQSILSWETTKFNGKEAQKINLLLAAGPTQYWFVRNSDEIYVIQLTDERVLKTFEFLDSSPIELQSCNSFEGAQFCTLEYSPVCAKTDLVESGPVTWKMFGNACTACISSTTTETVVGYLKGTCEDLLAK